MGKLIIYIGIALVVIGLLVNYAPGVFKWFGRLPGDIHIKQDNGSIFIPITSMIIISILFTIILNLFFRK
jgi:hypothetical protein